MIMNPSEASGSREFVKNLINIRATGSRRTHGTTQSGNKYKNTKLPIWKAGTFMRTNADPPEERPY